MDLYGANAADLDPSGRRRLRPHDGLATTSTVHQERNPRPVVSFDDFLRGFPKLELWAAKGKHYDILQLLDHVGL